MGQKVAFWVRDEDGAVLEVLDGVENQSAFIRAAILEKAGRRPARVQAALPGMDDDGATLETVLMEVRALKTMLWTGGRDGAAEGGSQTEEDPAAVAALEVMF